jgi:hypothetical protein
MHPYRAVTCLTILIYYSFTLNDKYTSERCQLRAVLYLSSIKELVFAVETYFVFFNVKGKGLPQQAEVAQGVPGRLRPLDAWHYEGGRSSALCIGRFYPRINPWHSFLVAELTPGHIVLSVATEKIPSDTTGNRSRDRPTSSAVP